MSKPELEGCPFCGGEEIYAVPIGTDDVDCYAMRCTACEAEGPPCVDVELIQAAWNARIPQWISVEERLPGEGEFVFAVPYHEDIGGMQIVCFCQEQSYGFHDHVTHWQPLPELPKQKTNTT